MTRTFLFTAFGLLCAADAAFAQCADQSAGPDVIVGDLNGIGDYGSVGSISAYSLGTTSCNVGDTELQWIASLPKHPVIGQNMYRLENGRFELLGFSWLKHGFTALQGSLCCSCISAGTGSRLGVGCSDPYGAGLNGSQSGLGPRFEVNAHTGAFSYPFFAQGATGDAIYKRIQVSTADLDPSLHPTARYFAEGHYIAPDDAAAGNGNNNASYREMSVGSFSGGSWNLGFAGSTQREKPAIQAWKDVDPNVRLEYLQVPGEGLFIVGSLATDNGDGTWHYEYAVHNLNSDRSGKSFGVPTAAGVSVTNVEFRDVPYHSGEPFDGTDWTLTLNPDSCVWTTVDFTADPDANALRWGTLYNFRFDADLEPRLTNATLGLFKPGTPGECQVAVFAPVDECTTYRYCVSSPNSQGVGARISTSGTLSIADDTFQVDVAGAIGSEFGIFFYGPQEASAEFGAGVLCVGAGATGLFRLLPPILADPSGAASRLVDFGSPPAGSGPGLIQPGDTWNFQYWYRDPLAAGGSGFNTSDAVSATFCP